MSNHGIMSGEAGDEEVRYLKSIGHFRTASGPRGYMTLPSSLGLSWMAHIFRFSSIRLTSLCLGLCCFWRQPTSCMGAVRTISAMARLHTHRYASVLVCAHSVCPPIVKGFSGVKSDPWGNLFVESAWPAKTWKFEIRRKSEHGVCSIAAERAVRLPSDLPKSYQSRHSRPLVTLCGKLRSGDIWKQKPRDPFLFFGFRFSIEFSVSEA